MHHLATFWEAREQPNIVLVHYADLQRDLEGEMRRIAHRLDIDIDEDRLAALVVAAGFDTMRERADELAPDASEGILQSNRAFFHSGRNGQWQQLLDDDGRRRYAERVTQLAPTDLIEWTHRRTHRHPFEWVAGWPICPARRDPRRRHPSAGQHTSNSMPSGSRKNSDHSSPRRWIWPTS